MDLPIFGECKQLYIFVIMVIISNLITLYMKWSTFDPIQKQFSKMVSNKEQEIHLETIKRDMYVKSIIFYVIVSILLYYLCRYKYSKIAWTIVGIYIAVVLIEIWFYNMLAKLSKIIPTDMNAVPKSTSNRVKKKNHT